MRLGLGLGLGESRVQFEIPEFVRQVRKKTVPEDLELKAPLPTWCVGVGVLSVLLGVEVGCHQSPLATLINWLNGTFNGSYVGGTRRGALLCAWRRSSPRRLPHAERIA